MAYWIDGVLFRKTIEVRNDAPHPDNNSNAELYCNDKFIELETLAPLKTLKPGDSATHAETWDIFYGLDSLPEEARQLLKVS